MVEVLAKHFNICATPSSTSHLVINLLQCPIQLSRFNSRVVSAAIQLHEFFWGHIYMLVRLHNKRMEQMYFWVKRFPSLFYTKILCIPYL